MGYKIFSYGIYMGFTWFLWRKSYFQSGLALSHIIPLFTSANPLGITIESPFNHIKSPLIHSTLELLGLNLAGLE
jgi:hypothetical protein